MYEAASLKMGLEPDTGRPDISSAATEMHFFTLISIPRCLRYWTGSSRVVVGTLASSNDRSSAKLRHAALVFVVTVPPGRLSFRWQMSSS